MNHNKKKFILITSIYMLTIIILQCAGNNQFTDDTEIQRDITITVNNYNSEDRETRLESIKHISKYSNTVYAKNSLLLLLKATEDPYSEIRIEALKFLKKMKAPSAEEKIGIIALSDENPNVRFFAFSALEEFGNIKDEGTFLKGINDPDWLVKEAALRGLMKINDPEVQNRHLDLILNGIKDKNISIRLTAISCINIKDPQIYSELAKIINDKESGLSLMKAALQKISGYKLDNKTKKRIIELLTHSDKDIRVLSLQVLKQEKSDSKL